MNEVSEVRGSIFWGYWMRLLTWMPIAAVPGFAVGVVSHGGWGLLAFGVATIAQMVWARRTRVEVSDEGVLVVNLYSSVFLPKPVKLVDSRRAWSVPNGLAPPSLRSMTTRRRVHAWAMWGKHDGEDNYWVVLWALRHHRLEPDQGPRGKRKRSKRR